MPSDEFSSPSTLSGRISGSPVKITFDKQSEKIDEIERLLESLSTDTRMVSLARLATEAGITGGIMAVTNQHGVERDAFMILMTGPHIETVFAKLVSKNE